MRIQLPHDEYDWNHLVEVADVMHILGAPKIHAVWVARLNAWMALEGSHRIRAARILGLIPEIIEVEYSDASTDDIVPGQYQDTWTIKELVDSNLSEIIDFDKF